MHSKIKKNKEKDFSEPTLSIDKVADANTVIGKSIITVSGSEVIPLSSVTVVNLSGGGEYGGAGEVHRHIRRRQRGEIAQVVDVHGPRNAVPGGQGGLLNELPHTAVADQ